MGIYSGIFSGNLLGNIYSRILIYKLEGKNSLKVPGSTDISKMKYLLNILVKSQLNSIFSHTGIILLSEEPYSIFSVILQHVFDEVIHKNVFSCNEDKYITGLL